MDKRSLIETYASDGDLNGVRHVLTQPQSMSFVEKALYQAAKNNHMHVVGFIRLTYISGIKGLEIIIDGACAGNNMSLVKYALNQACDSHELVSRTIRSAIQHNTIDILRYVFETFEVSEESIAECVACVIEHGNYDLYKLIETHIDVFKTYAELIKHVYLRDEVLSKIKHDPSPFFVQHRMCLLCSDYNGMCVLTNCQHSFHRSCITEYIKNTQNNVCPSCPSCGSLFSKNIVSSTTTNDNIYKCFTVAPPSTPPPQQTIYPCFS